MTKTNLHASNFIIKYFLCVLSFVLLSQNTAFANAFDSPFEKSDIPTISATSAVVIDAKSGAVLFDKKKDERNFPASITKLATVLIALEYVGDNPDLLNERVLFSRNAVFSIERSSSNIAMDENETLTIEQCLYAMLLSSANEVSNALAEHLGETTEEFANITNQRLKALGCTNTNFVNPHGLHDDDHYTTAADMAKIMQQLVKYPLFMKIIATTHTEIPPTERQAEVRPLNNSNKMIYPSSQYYNELIVGGKTGFTDQAKNTLVTFAKSDDKEIVTVIMHDENFDCAYNDTTILVDYALKQFTTATLFDAQTYKSKIAVATTLDDKKGDVAFVDVTAQKDLVLTIPQAIVKNVKVVYDLPKEIVENVNVGDKIGVIKAVYKDEILAQTDAVASNSATIEAKALQTFAQTDKTKSTLTKFFDNFNIQLALWLVFGIIIILVAIQFAFNRRNRRWVYGANYSNRKPKRRRR